MEVLRQLPQAGSRSACGLAIGNFDGVHLGHQAIVRQLIQASQELPVSVMTFEPHPREFFARRSALEAPPRISTETDKLDALAACGVNTTFIIPFDETIASMPASDFIDTVIRQQLNASHLLVGDDFRFGHRRTGDFAMLAEAQSRGAFELHRMQTLTHEGQRVSSSLVRTALADGDFGLVRQLLGRAYTISGEVAHGQKLGRELGFPTLNIDLPFNRPALSGVFVVQVHGLAARALPSVASLGVRPAVQSDGSFKLEVHVLDFAEQVYGRKIKVEFLHKLRDEENYDTVGALKSQIAIDTQQARDFFHA